MILWIFCTTVFEGDYLLAVKKMAKMCTGAIAMHKFNITVYRCNEEVSLSTIPVSGPEISGGRE
jgi:hypothetical protein